MRVTGTSDLMRTAISNCQHDAGDRVVNAAKRLHRRRCQPDLVADGVAVLAAQQRNIFLLDVVSVSDGRGRGRRSKALELFVGLVCGEQCFGCATRGDIVHGCSPFAADLNVPEAAVKHVKGRAMVPCGTARLA